MSVKQMNEKILVLTSDFPPTSGGIQTIISETFRRFENKNIIIIAPAHPHSQEFDKLYPIPILRCKFLKPFTFFPFTLTHIFKKSFMFTFFGILPLIRIIKSYKCSFLICGHIAVSPLALLVRRLFGLPYLTFVYAMEILCLPKECIRRKVLQILFQNSTKVITISKFSIDEIRKFGVAKGNIIKIPLGYPCFPESEENLGEGGKIEDGEFKILTVGRLVERKGHDKVLEALSLLRKKRYKIKYVIVGEGPMKQNLLTLCKKFGVEKQVEFIGNVTYSQTPFYYKMCDLFIMPSRYIKAKKDVEGFGLVYLEANFFGKPVIAGRSGGVPDAVIEGVTGFLVDPENPKEIANAIIKLFENPDLAKKMGEQGRRRVMEEFTWERAARIIEENLMAVSKGNKGCTMYDDTKRVNMG
ncbi:MAG: glycosyltransferase family 1 protein [Candidatus Cloacimonadota bacterium]|nr:MAG: glycosyltransferase family 1 protein [Candidatus Cloacimonadota bacterium]